MTQITLSIRFARQSMLAYRLISRVGVVKPLLARDSIALRLVFTLGINYPQLSRQRFLKGVLVVVLPIVKAKVYLVGVGVQLRQVIIIRLRPLFISKEIYTCRLGLPLRVFIVKVSLLFFSLASKSIRRASNSLLSL